MDSIFYINPNYNSVNSLVYWYHFIPEENMCPSNYGINVDTQSWGMCSCWENRGFRSKNGTIPTCRPLLPATNGDNDPLCSPDVLCQDGDTFEMCIQPHSPSNISYWCQQSAMSSLGQLCPTTNVYISDNGTAVYCTDADMNEIEAVKDVPSHKVSN